MSPSGHFEKIFDQIDVFPLRFLCKYILNAAHYYKTLLRLMFAIKLNKNKFELNRACQNAYGNLLMGRTKNAWK